MAEADTAVVAGPVASEPPVAAVPAAPVAPVVPAAAASAAPPVPGAATLAGGAPPPDARVAVTTTWPEDWRLRAVGGDEKLAKSLETLATPEALAKSYMELRTKLSSGELKATVKPLAADAKPEEIAAWRKEQNIPDDAAAYVAGLKLPDGVVPGEADKPLLESFADRAFKANWTGQQYAEAVGWYYAVQDQLDAKQRQDDADYQRQSGIELLRDWGNQYESNRNAVKNFWEAVLPQDLQGAFLTARMPDGTVLGDHPMVSKAFLELANIVAPASTVLPIGMAPTMQNVDSRIGDIEKMMRAPDKSEAWRGYWQNGKVQEEYRGLLDAREKMKARAA